MGLRGPVVPDSPSPDVTDPAWGAAHILQGQITSPMLAYRQIRGQVRDGRDGIEGDVMVHGRTRLNACPVRLQWDIDGLGAQGALWTHDV